MRSCGLAQRAHFLTKEDEALVSEDYAANDKRALRCSACGHSDSCLHEQRSQEYNESRVECVQALQDKFTVRLTSALPFGWKHE